MQLPPWAPIFKGRDVGNEFERGGGDYAKEVHGRPRRQINQVIVVDIESTCWEGQPPAGQENEIIEVGICVLEVSSGKRLSKEGVIVKSKSEVSPFCTKLTTLTQADVDKGIPLAEACKILTEKYDSKNRPWASYGDYDRRQFERECRAKGIGYPFGYTHINVKNWFALRHKLSREVGMMEALKIFQVSPEGTHHRGCDDAWNIGLILSKLI